MQNHIFSEIDMGKSPKVYLLILFFVVVTACASCSHERVLEPIGFTAHEKAWLESHPHIRIAPEENYPPFIFVDPQGEIKGISADYISLLEKKIGIEFSFVQPTPLADILEKARGKKVDLITSLKKTPQRQSYLTFTESYIAIPAVIIARQKDTRKFSLPEMDGMRIAVGEGYGVQNFLLENYPDLDVRGVKDDLVGLQKLSFQEIDAVVMDIASASYLISREGIGNLRVVGETGYTYDLSLAVRKDWPELRDVLNKGFANITEQEREAIRSRWIQFQAPFVISKEVLAVVVLLSGIVTFFVGFIWFSNRKLKKEISARHTVEQELKRSYDELSKAENLLAARFKLSELAMTANLDRIMQATVDEAEIFTASKMGFFHFVNEDQETLTLQAWSSNTLNTMCPAEGKGKHYPLSQAGVWVDCIHQRAPVLHQDYASLPHKKGLPDGHVPIVRELTLPIIRGEKVKAVIGVGNKETEYTEQDINVVKELASFAIDLIERKQLEDEYRESAERLDLAMSVNNDGIFDWDVPKDFIYYDPRYYTMAGYEPGDYPGTYDEWAKRVHPEDFVHTEKAVKAYLAGELLEYDEEFRFKCKDGTWMWIRARIKVVERDENGAPLRIVGTHTDITASKQAEEALKESERRYRQMFRDNKAIKFLIDPSDGRIVEANNAAVEFYQYPLDRLISMKISEINMLPPDKIQKEMNDTKNKEKHFFVFPHKKSSGEIRTVEVYSSPITVQGKTLLFSIVHDVTEREKAAAENKQLKAQWRQSQKLEAVGTLAGGIAHDFNNILGIILGYADMAKGGAPPDSKLSRDLSKIIQTSHRARDLVQQILTFSRQAQIEKVSLRPKPIIKETLKMLRASIPSTIEIQENISRDCGNIDANPTQLHQILLNLCTNASHAMEGKGGILKVDLGIADSLPLELTAEKPEAEDTFLELSISDTGGGIAPGIIDRIFDPFFTTKEEGKGTGMGLAITYGIVKDYGGAIIVNSQLGKGTTFQIYLPRSKRETMPLPPKEATPAEGKERILFVDDEELLTELGKDMLERLGYHVIAKQRSIEALEAFQNQPDEFDLVITDQTMPGMTGFDLARRMLQIRPDIPIILCTGYSALVDEEMVKAQGIKAFVRKPVTMTSIAQLIRKLMNTGKSV